MGYFYLAQLLRRVNVDKFYLVFQDLDYLLELNEMKTNDIDVLVSDILFDDFGIELECPDQLNRIIGAMRNPRTFKLCCEQAGLSESLIPS